MKLKEVKLKHSLNDQNAATFHMPNVSNEILKLFLNYHGWYVDSIVPIESLSFNEQRSAQGEGLAIKDFLNNYTRLGLLRQRSNGIFEMVCNFSNFEQVL